MAKRQDSPPPSPKPRWGVWLGMMGLNLALTLGLIGSGVQIYRWRQEDGGAVWFLVSLGLLSTLAVALRLLNLGPRATPKAMIEVCLTLWGIGLALIAGIGLGLPLLFLLVQLPSLIGQPWLFLPWLMVILPTLALSLWEWGTAAQVARTPANLGWLLALYLAYFVGMNGLILIALGAFIAVVPLGIGLQLISGINLLVLWARESDSLPLLCHWVDQRTGALLGSAIVHQCHWVLWGFHLGHGVILGLGIGYGQRIFDGMATRYGQGLRWLRDRLTPP